MSRCVWALVDDGIIEHLSYLDEGNARDWLANLIDTLKHEDQVRVFLTLWAVWHARRKAMHEQIYQSPLSVHFFMENFIVDVRHDEEKEKVRRAPI
jgi:uncharacterized protein YbaP (TraB family)